MAHLDARLLLGLVGSLYEAALDDALWADMAGQVANLFQASSTVLKVQGAKDFDLVSATDNLMIPQSRQGWADHWHSRDLWVERSAAYGVGKVVIGEELLGAADLEATGFYQDWLRQLGVYHMVGGVFRVDEAALGVLGIHRDRDAPGFEEDDRQAVADFMPHLQRAFRLRGALAAARTAGSLAVEALERLAVGALAVDANRRILYANRHAERLLRGAPELQAQSGRLGLADPGLDGRLGAMVRAAAALGRGGPAPADTALAAPREGRLPLTLLVAPLRREWRDAGFGPGALVLLRDPEAPGVSAALLRSMFGLTGAEAAVAAALAEGLSPDDIARRFAVGIGTVRTHLKSVLAKTGIRRQPQLVGLLSRSVAAVTPPDKP